MKKLIHIVDIAQLRKREYPPLEDFADALYWMSKGEPDKLREYYAKCDEVKKKYPKQRS